MARVWSGKSTGGALLHLLPAVGTPEDLTRVAAIIGTDDAVLGHEVDESGRSSVADAERPLQQRNAAAAFTHDDFDPIVRTRTEDILARRNPTPRTDNAGLRAIENPR